MNQRKRRSVFGMVAAAGLSLLLAVPALAQEATIASVIGGSLSVTTPAAADFEEKTITGVDQTTTAALAAFSVSDLRGLGLGWHVTAAATTFTAGAHSLAAGSLSMTQPTVASPGTLSPDPTVASGPYIIDGGAVEIASAALLAGMGVYNFGATTLTLSLPADVYAGNYASTVTISVVAGP
jgi:hypothetical protein